MSTGPSLDFQTAISKSTLIFGSARWSNWSAFDYTPVVYKTITGGKSLISYQRDNMDYSLGVGHKFNANWSGAVTVGYQPSHGLFTGNLGPTDGNESIGVAAVYTQGNMKITGGVKYVWVGSAQPSNNGTTAAANFTGNHAIGVGLKIGYSF
jgi:long-chain fatty acid transport protein